MEQITQISGCSLDKRTRIITEEESHELDILHDVLRAIGFEDPLRNPLLEQLRKDRYPKIS